MDIRATAAAAKAASLPLAAASGDAKDRALGAMAEGLRSSCQSILDANAKDLAAAEAEGLAAPLRKRLRFDGKKLDEVVTGIESLMALPDPVGLTERGMELDQGFELYRVSCPIGVIGVIFESRPDALVQISTLCLKSGNAALLKGGREAVHTNRALADVLVRAAAEAGMPAGWLQLLETRAEVTAMLALDDLIDLIIPRGSNAFVRFIMEHSSIPVLGHADGICHVYVDGAAELAKAVAITVDSKCQYVAVCNAAETLLVHEDVAAAFLPAVKEELEARGVSLVGCPRTAAIIPVGEATEEDWRTEYLDYRLSIRVVRDLAEAIDHINTYGSGHTDAIVTEDRGSAARFLNLVDAGNVFWNCSTRFSDGYRYGLGAEVGISTNKIHARGPVGLEGLLIYKWKLIGQGQTVAEYAQGQRRFTHRPLHRECPL
ncbi:MAG: glutamate-5-semialdehyde dehydrogenase [Lentisphaeria bacterium]|nr:glutamate-5-semialdehyde dehydrogenase [Lentisphaeria bacterium]